METIIFLIFGMIWGSFINVCIYRIPAGVSVVTPSSYCPSCRRKIKFYDLIPVFSYLFLRGHCRHCKAFIDWHYPVVELLTGLLTVILYDKFGMTGLFWKYLLLTYGLIVIALIDLKWQWIPDKLSIPGLVLGLLWALFMGKTVILDSLLGALLGAAVLAPIAYFYPQGMGWGDVKLLALIGSVLGVKLVIYTLFIGATCGALVGSFLVLLKIISRKTPIPFGPFLAGGAIISVLL